MQDRDSPAAKSLARSGVTGQAPWPVYQNSGGVTVTTVTGFINLGPYPPGTRVTDVRFEATYLKATEGFSVDVRLSNRPITDGTALLQQVSVLTSTIAFGSTNVGATDDRMAFTLSLNAEFTENNRYITIAVAPDLGASEAICRASAVIWPAGTKPC